MPRLSLRTLWLATLLGLLALGRAWSQVAEPEARDLRERVMSVEVLVQDLYGRREQRTIPVTVYLPPGEGPFPLLVLNHGRATSPEARAQTRRFRYEQQARYFVGKGLAVMVPTRVGYGSAMLDEFDPEYSGGCSAPQVGAMSLAASDQVLAVVQAARSLPEVDTSRWWVAGQSVGGLTSVATVMRRPEGLQGGINFAGGTGGDPKARPGRPCAVPQIASQWRRALPGQPPMVWLYWENDLYWGAEHPRQWHRAFTEGGAQAEFVQLSPVGEDGHLGFARDMDRWTAVVDRFLGRWGLNRPALPPVPLPSGFAAVEEADKVPISAAQRNKPYATFLASSKPRAFAIGTSGSVGHASGDWAMGRALGFCQARSGQPCRLYAVDDQVVWHPPCATSVSAASPSPPCAP